ncbi:hypothetical protein LCGC14_2524130, partial [marine sediment metagenome]
MTVKLDAHFRQAGRKGGRVRPLTFSIPYRLVGHEPG